MRPSRLPLATLCLISSVVAVRTADGEELKPEAADHFETQVRPRLVEFCGDCHDPEDEDNHVNFLLANRADGLNDDRELWKSVAEQLRNRTMPPADSPFQP
ncbi:MAG: c-type cytochrome domain-containing protein, partial [Planctomycetota bacterium]